MGAGEVVHIKLLTGSGFSAMELFSVPGDFATELFNSFSRLGLSAAKDYKSK